MEYRVTTEELWGEEERIRGILGRDRLLYNLEKAMGTDMLEDLLAYVCRCQDIKTPLRENNR